MITIMIAMRKMQENKSLHSVCPKYSNLAVTVGWKDFC